MFWDIHFLLSVGELDEKIDITLLPVNQMQGLTASSELFFAQRLESGGNIDYNSLLHTVLKVFLLSSNSRFIVKT